MRPRFRRSKSTESPVTDAPDGPDGPDGSVAPDGLVAPDGSGDDGPGPSFDLLLARQLDRADRVVDSATAPTPTTTPTPTPVPEAPATSPLEPSSGDPSPGDFWEHFDRAKAEAELAALPPAAVVAVVGPLPAALPVIRRCRDRHWMGECDVFVLTQHRAVPGETEWNVVSQPSDLVAVLDEGRSDFPLLVLDVPHDLPAFVRPLIARLRQSGVGLVHYVLDDDPDDEDLATWYGELGQPSVLELAAPVEPARVLELLDRGDPVVSVAGRDLGAELILAFRVHAERASLG